MIGMHNERSLTDGQLVRHIPWIITKLQPLEKMIPMMRGWMKNFWNMVVVDQIKITNSRWIYHPSIVNYTNMHVEKKEANDESKIHAT